MGRPVERAERSARGDVGVGGGEGALADAVRDEGANPALVAIPLRDDERAQTAGERVDFEMGRGPLDLVEQAEHMRLRESAQALRQRIVAPPCLGKRAEQRIERPVLAEIEQFVLAAEVVIQVRGGEVRGDGDVAHAGGGETACPEDGGGSFQDPDPPRIGPT